MYHISPLKTTIKKCKCGKVESPISISASDFDATPPQENNKIHLKHTHTYTLSLSYDGNRQIICIFRSD